MDVNFLWWPSSYPRASPMTQQVKEYTCSAGDTGDACSIPGLGTSPGGENGNPLQYSCLENPMDRGAWWARVQRVAKSRTWLSTRMRVNCKRLVWGWAKTLRCRTLQALCFALPRQISPWSPPPEMHNKFSLDELGTSGVAGQLRSPLLPEPGQTATSLGFTEPNADFTRHRQHPGLRPVQRFSWGPGGLWVLRHIPRTFGIT